MFPPVFSALRAYVLAKSKLLAIFILVLSLVPAGVNLVSVLAVSTKA